jgi:hypothetical protein
LIVFANPYDACSTRQQGNRYNGGIGPEEQNWDVRPEEDDRPGFGDARDPRTDLPQRRTACQETARQRGVAVFTSIMQSVATVAVFYIMFSILGIRGAAIRGDFLLYIMSGVFMFFTHIKAIGAVFGSEGPASPMMQHLPMTTAIAIASAALSALYVQVLTVIVILSVYHLGWGPITIYDPVGAMGMLLLAWFSGVAIGMLFLGLKPWAPGLANILQMIFTRANMIASGKMFVANAMPGYMVAPVHLEPALPHHRPGARVRIHQLQSPLHLDQLSDLRVSRDPDGRAHGGVLYPQARLRELGGAAMIRLAVILWAAGALPALATQDGWPALHDVAGVSPKRRAQHPRAAGRVGARHRPPCTGCDGNRGDPAQRATDLGPREHRGTDRLGLAPLPRAAAAPVGRSVSRDRVLLWNRTVLEYPARRRHADLLRPGERTARFSPRLEVGLDQADATAST